MSDLLKEKPDIENRSAQMLRIVMSWVVVAILATFGAFSLYRFSNVHKTEGDF
jgi:phosphate/sulfate permease